MNTQSNERIIYTHSLTLPRLGPLTLYSDGTHLIGLAMPTQKYNTIGTAQYISKTLPIFEETEAWLHAYEEGNDPGPVPPLQPEGTDFRKRVWHALLTIPYGRLTTYGDLATVVYGNKCGGLSARAIGGAVGHNPIPIIIPCHRVIGHDGSLTGYTGGLDIKIRLLELEHLTVTDNQVISPPLISTASLITET